MSGGEADLSGRWTGLFNYPDGGPATPFEAELSDIGGSVTGTTTEQGETPETIGETLQAVIDGRREGSALRFLKMYDGAAGDYDVVHYEGEVQPGCDEIEGRWTIPGIWSGTFLMVRHSGAAAKIEEKTGEEIGLR
jgi:hypothetical protein